MEKIARIDLSSLSDDELRGLDVDNFLKELKKREVNLKEILPLNDEPALADYLLKDLEIDLELDIVYPEGGFDLIKYDKASNSLILNGCRYLLKFIQKENGGDEYIWYSGYKDLSNLTKEIRLWDLENSI